MLYHGTHVQNIKTLKPFATQGNAISKPVICFTANPHIALFYIWEKAHISKTTVRAIHMQKLLFPSHSTSKTEQIDFVRSHFPKEWETASKMTTHEIEQMIKEWKASLHNNNGHCK